MQCHVMYRDATRHVRALGRYANFAMAAPRSDATLAAALFEVCRDDVPR